MPKCSICGVETNIIRGREICPNHGCIEDEYKDPEDLSREEERSYLQ